MSAARVLIVNADDFGLSAGVNAGVVQAHERGIVTSASLMVRQPAAEEAAAYGRAHPDLGLGLHLDLGEWTFRVGEWETVYEVAPLDDPVAVGEEAARQLSRFRELVGEDPTHMDSHQHVHRREPVRSAVLRALEGHRAPVRHCTPGVRYCGEFYGQTDEGSPVPDAISVEALSAVLKRLSPGVTELACHPARGTDADGMYTAERESELEVLCDPRVRDVLAAESIRLESFGEVLARAS